MKTNPILVSPSILSADFLRLGEEVAAVEAAGADWIHCDMMDGRFVPNLSFGPVVVGGLKGRSQPLDVHLMVEQPELYLEAMVNLGAHAMTVHVEACVHLERTLKAIRSHGMLAGVAMNPSTSPEFLTYVKHTVDIVLVMTVNPGFSGQAFLTPMLDKVRRVRELTRDVSHRLRVSVDGGVNPETARLSRLAGADILVAASAIFGTGDYAAAISALRSP